jgi:WD40 repeat protein
MTHSENNTPVRAVAFAPDGKSAVSADGSRIRVWNVLDAKLVGEMTGFQNDIYALLNDGENIVAGSADQSVRQFNPADRSVIRALAPHSAWVLSLAWHPSSARLAAGCFDGTVTTWNLENGSMVKQFLAIPVVEQPNN